ncbi:MAG: TatD family hydrolase [Patescibacteria group bacterium]
MPRLIDSHAHVQFQDFAGETDELLRRTVADGIWVNLIGTQSTTSKNAVETAERLGDGVFASIGLHPSHLAQMHFDEDELAVKTRDERFDAAYYAPLAAHPKTVAVGECGLDYFHLPEKIPFNELRALQCQQFSMQLDFAHEHDLPVVIHCRDGSTPLTTGAHVDLTAILAEHFSRGRNPRRGVMHCYTGDWPAAERYLTLGMYISFSGIVTFPPRKTGEGSLGLQEAAKNVPTDRLLVETDAPYLAPIPHRGERNEPLHVAHVARYLASLRGVTEEVISAQTTANAQALFRKMAV